MVDAQIARRGIRDARVLSATREVPREIFVDSGMEEFAYEDTHLPIGSGQTISQPYVVSMMIEAVELKRGRRTLSRQSASTSTGSGSIT